MNLEYSFLGFLFHMLSLQAYTMMATHYQQLCSLEHLYPNVKNYHLVVNCVLALSSHSNISFPFIDSHVSSHLFVLCILDEY